MTLCCPRRQNIGASPSAAGIFQALAYPQREPGIFLAAISFFHGMPVDIGEQYA